MASRGSGCLARPVVDAIGLSRLTELVSTLSVRGDGFAVTVEVDGQVDSTAKTLMAAIDGREQSRATSIIAAIVSMAIHDTTVLDGVHHVHEILDSEPIFDVLRDQGYRFTNSERMRKRARQYTNTLSRCR